MGWFDYKAPCKDCPFRRSQAGNYRLRLGRLREIFTGTAFECHKTTGVEGVKREPQQCAGLIAVQHSEGQYNAITIIAMAKLGYDPGQIDTADTFTTFKAVEAAHNPDFGEPDASQP